MNPGRPRLRARAAEAGRQIIRRLAQTVPVLLVVAIVTFTLLHLLPGDPAVMIAGDQASPEVIARIRTDLGLDRPLIEQLLRWLAALLHGDFGRSLLLNQSVLSAVAERLPVTMSLALISLIITLPAGVLMGSLAAYYRGSWLDSSVMGVALLGVSIPSFWIGIVSILLFGAILHWLPTGGYVPLSQGLWRWLACLIQPAVVLALFQIGFLARLTRSAMLDILHQDFIRTARAKGLGEWLTVARHAFRNTLIPVITAIGIILSLLIGGSVIVEQVFALPGMGRLVVQAIMARDYPLVQGTLLLFGLAFVLINLAIDGVYILVDPRVRYG
jgi:peptide/nickel transport system permease protein